MKSIADEQLPVPSRPLSKPVPPSMPPNTIANVSKEKVALQISGNMGCRSFNSGIPEP